MNGLVHDVVYDRIVKLYKVSIIIREGRRKYSSCQIGKR